MEKLSYPKQKIKVLLLENIHPKAVQIFQEDGFTNVEHLDRSLNDTALIAKIKEAHVVGIRSGTSLTKEVLNQCNKLLAIGCFCIGTDRVDLHASLLKGIPVFNDPHSNSRSVAELVIGLCIGLMRDLFNKNASAHAGEWKKRSEGAHELRGKILGIIGYGRIGSQLSILAEAMGMQVIYYDIEQKLSLGNVKPMQLEELLRTADVVSLHVPETRLTQNLINKEKLGLLKKTAFLINTSRGRVVDLDALAACLEKKAIQGAAIDVFSNEPANSTIPFISPLQKLNNAILTPHIGGATEEAQENIAQAVSQKLIYFINRGGTEGSVNFPSLSLSPNNETHRILHIHENKPQMLSQINKIIADREINILGQYLKTNEEVGYVVLDIQKRNQEDTHALQEALKEIKGTIRVRILY